MLQKTFAPGRIGKPGDIIRNAQGVETLLTPDLADGILVAGECLSLCCLIDRLPGVVVRFFANFLGSTPASEGP